jgi:hypothetical protein
VRGLPVAAAAVVLLVASNGHAQFGGGAMPPRRPPPPKQQPKHSDDEDEDRGSILRSEPVIAPPQDPLAMSPETRERIGTDWNGGPPPPEGSLVHRQWFPVYEERRGDYQFRMLTLMPPLMIEQTRGLRDPSQQRYGEPQTEDTEGLYGLLYYRRRSLHLDMDVVFPALWRARSDDATTYVAGPVVHREAPGEHDNWLAPLFFEGERKDGGYFHSPLILTTSHWNAAGAFTLAGLYFRDRTGTNTDWGVAPFLFRGDNGDLEGNHRAYTLIPPLFYYHSEHELDSTETRIVGPYIGRDDPKRMVRDVLPFVFYIEGKPLTGGVPEYHLTVFPFFHYGRDPDGDLLVLPGFYRHTTATSDAIIDPLYSVATTRRGATRLRAIGPIAPLYWDYYDRDLGVNAWAAAPFYYTSDSPMGHDWLTPLVGHFQTYGLSSTWWVFPSLAISNDTRGWETDLYPIAFVGHSEQSSHTVVAPVFWDFANPKGRTTIGFPLYWRFADGADESVLQVAANTLYIQKRVAGGLDWQFHLLPLFSYGQSPTGYFWNVLFGLAGYTRDGATATGRALWIPFDMGSAPPAGARAASAY